MLKNVVLVAATLSCLFSFPSSAENATLDEIDAMRMSDPSTAKARLSTVEYERLSDEEKLHYRYLDSYFFAFSHGLPESLARFDDLLDDAIGSHVEDRLMVTMLSLSAYSGEWAQSFTLAEKLEDRLDGMTEQDRINTILGLIVFYQRVDQFDMAMYYISTLLNSDNISPSDRCYAVTHKMQIEEEKNDGSLNQPALENAIAVCKAAQHKLFHAINHNTFLLHLVKIEDVYKAKEVARDTAALIDDIGLDFTHLKSSFTVGKAKLALLEEDWDKAKALASEALSIDTGGKYESGLIDSLEVLVKAEKATGNFEAAVGYLEDKLALKKEFHSREIAQSLARQEARFKIAEAESAMALLDKENKLAEAREEKLYLALSLVSLLLAGLIFWSYRSRRVQIKLRELARKDSLTGIFNRGYFEERAKRLLSRAQHQNNVVSMALLDLDHFKQINDTYGHQIGDWVLREVVRALCDACDDTMTLGRLGGEEFGIVITNCNAEQGLNVAEACRAAIENISSQPTGHRFTLTASFGVADTSQAGYNFENLSSACDLALYQSKQYGRNRVYEYDSKMNPI
ncbi:diguanylate cyclase [Alteromonas sp. H39]|uniref:sensor domain-containing diguanylate cyclase n=1 Tax=Alteromonas sp. H39 TaxID=3389876 RepID=UPI0039E01EB8